MTLFFIIAFKESEVSGEILDVYMALRFYLFVCVCAHAPVWLVAFSVCDSSHFPSIYFLLLYICLLPVMMIGIKHV